MRLDLFEFKSYRSYLLAQVGPKTQRRGLKSRLAHGLRCQPSLLSQVLSGKVDLSLEQGEAVNRFFNHTALEAKYFILLLLHARAGTSALKSHFAEQLTEIRDQRALLSQRIGKTNALTPTQKSLYYSSWHYAAIHMATTIPALQGREELAHFFSLPIPKVSAVLQALEEMGLIDSRGGRLRPGVNEIFVGSDSELILRHHANWRMRAIDSLDQEDEKDLHYSAIATLSQEDCVKVKTECMRFIQDLVQTLKSSSEEKLYAFGMDFFSLQKRN